LHLLPAAVPTLDDPPPRAEGHRMQAPETLDHGAVVASIEGPVAHVELNRDEKRNAVNAAMAQAFLEVDDELAARGVTASVLTARGSLFCAGVDLKEPRLPGQPAPFVPMLERLRGSDRLWVAAVQGGAIGAGVALALACPLVLMSADAWLWLPEVSKTGRAPLGVLRWVGPVIGPRGAFDLAFSERKVGAEEAASRGWITAAHAPEDLLPAARALAGRAAGAEADSIREAVALWSVLSAPVSH
ncbi:MAG TPA: enoyl-CoA hydratase/isomerase family protein, partial [Candidatus Limnocylindria bacterium]|nr:enoyl-CoA hydratase/isomerase family protein [Candidatus Limnocylindria bacterium]